MQVNFSSSNNNVYQNNITFGSGMTPQIAEYIRHADISKISKKLAQEGIENDFKDNKVVAWCCDKTVEIFKQLNERYNLKLALPKGIFVEDFEKLNLKDSKLPCFCNFLPTKLKIDSSIIIPEKTLFFNSFETQKVFNDEIGCNNPWGNINSIADYRFLQSGSATSNFLDDFFHEFSHAAHEDRLIKKNTPDELVKKLEKIEDKQENIAFQEKYGQKLSLICDYAKRNQLEALSCDLSRTIASSLDKNLNPTYNPFKNSPYETNFFHQLLKTMQNKNKQDLSLQDILRNFWNGKFD